MFLKEISFVLIAGLLSVAAVRFVENSNTESIDEQTSGMGTDQPTLDASSTGYSDQVRIVRNNDGHFYADLMVNRIPVSVLVDTGASMLALRASDAEAAGLYPRHKDFSFPVNTANGQTTAALMTVREIELGMLVVRNAEAFILPDESLAVSLLGMNVLSELGEVGFNQSELVIERHR